MIFSPTANLIYNNPLPPKHLVPCPFLQKKGRCKKGSFCDFSHDILRNCVNRERKKCRSKYYEAKVKHLKSCKSSDWWREVKKLSGMNSAFNSKNEVYKSLENLNETATSTKHLANIINGIFLSPMNDFSPLASELFRLY